jgi:hypothetical protein
LYEETEYKSQTYDSSIGTSEGERRLGRPKRKWEDNIKNQLQEISFENVDWIRLGQDGDKIVGIFGQQSSFMPFHLMTLL